MKDYKMIIKVTSEKGVVIGANSAKQAAEMGIELCSDLSKLKLSESDVVSVEGSVLDDKQEENCTQNCEDCNGFCHCIDECIECENCNNSCPSCGMCKLYEEAYKTSDECKKCEFYCVECGACTCDDVFEDEYVDAELELRKEIFKDYISDKIDEVIAYGKDLFEVE